MLQSGAADICMVVGVLADLSPLALQGFYNVGAMGGHSYQDHPEKASRPFDKRHEGFIYGQGAGCMIIETKDFAIQRQARILGELCAVAHVLDGHGLSEPNLQGEIRVMKHALRQAKLEPEQIDYINTHGTSAPLGDTTEIHACQSVFGKHLSRCWINATKGLIGHTLWSAGVIEAIATLCQLTNGYVHGNRNLEAPIVDNARFVGATTQPAQITTALSNSFGFGGINTSIVIKKWEAL